MSIEPICVENQLCGISMKVMTHGVPFNAAEILAFRINIRSDSATKSIDDCVWFEEKLAERIRLNRTDRIAELSR